METRKELIEAVGHRYRTAPKGEKSKILDEFATLARYHRKHAIRILNGAPHDSLQKAARNRLYDEAVLGCAGCAPSNVQSPETAN